MHLASVSASFWNRSKLNLDKLWGYTDHVSFESFNIKKSVMIFNITRRYQEFTSCCQEYTWWGAQINVDLYFTVLTPNFKNIAMETRTSLHLAAQWKHMKGDLTSISYTSTEIDVDRQGDKKRTNTVFHKYSTWWARSPTMGLSKR